MVRALMEKVDNRQKQIDNTIIEMEILRKYQKDTRNNNNNSKKKNVEQEEGEEEEEEEEGEEEERRKRKLCNKNEECL